MKRLSLRFPIWTRAMFTVTLLVSLTTGVLWFCLERWAGTEGEFGPEKHPWVGTLTKIHGASAFSSMVAFGMILAGHIPSGWATRRRRASGLANLTLIGTSVFTAYGLYYAGSDDFRSGLVWFHLGAGLFMPATILIHVLRRPPPLTPSTSTGNHHQPKGKLP